MGAFSDAAFTYWSRIGKSIGLGQFDTDPLHIWSFWCFRVLVLGTSIVVLRFNRYLCQCDDRRSACLGGWHAGAEIGRTHSSENHALPFFQAERRHHRQLDTEDARLVEDPYYVIDFRGRSWSLFHWPIRRQVGVMHRRHFL